MLVMVVFFFFFQAEDGIRDRTVTGVQTCALRSALLTTSRCSANLRWSWAARPIAGLTPASELSVQLPDRGAPGAEAAWNNTFAWTLCFIRTPRAERWSIPAATCSELLPRLSPGSLALPFRLPML